MKTSIRHGSISRFKNIIMGLFIYNVSLLHKGVDPIVLGELILLNSTSEVEFIYN